MNYCPCLKAVPLYNLILNRQQKIKKNFYVFLKLAFICILGRINIIGQIVFLVKENIQRSSS